MGLSPQYPSSHPRGESGTAVFCLQRSKSLREQGCNYIIGYKRTNQACLTSLPLFGVRELRAELGSDHPLL